MRFSIAAATTALIGLATANFDIYEGTDNGFGTGNQFRVWTVHPFPPDCKRVIDAVAFDDSDDVSGDKIGVRCDGPGCGLNDPGNVDILEMHFSNPGRAPLYHFTIYKARGHPYKMYGLDGRTYGECIVFPGDDYTCGLFDFSVRGGVRMFRCLTDVTVEDIERAWHSS